MSEERYLAKAIRTIRADLTQGELGELVGVDGTQVSQWELGNRRVGWRSLFHLHELSPEGSEERAAFLRAMADQLPDWCIAKIPEVLAKCQREMS